MSGIPPFGNGNVVPQRRRQSRGQSRGRSPRRGGGEFYRNGRGPKPNRGSFHLEDRDRALSNDHPVRNLGSPREAGELTPSPQDPPQRMSKRDRYWITNDDEETAQSSQKNEAVTPVRKTLEERKEAVGGIQEQFVLLATMGDATMNYRENARPIWSAVPKAKIADVCLKVISEIPSAWQAVLGFISNLVHESTHFHFVNHESRSAKHNVSNLDDALMTITAELRKIVKNQENVTKNQLIQFFKLLCTFFADLRRLNAGRPYFSKKPSEFALHAFKNTPAVKEMLNLWDLLLERLIEIDPEECTKILIDTSKHGFHFEWIWYHLVNSFAPSQIVENLVRCGTQDFAKYLDLAHHTESIQQNTPLAMKQHDEYRVKFTAIKDVFVFLARKNNAELKFSCLQVINNVLSAPVIENHCEDKSLLFLLRLLAHSTELLRFLATDLVKLIDYRNILRAAKMINTCDKKYILASGISYPQFLAQAILVLPGKDASKLMNKLLPIAYMAHDLHSPEDMMLADGAAILLDQVANSVLNVAHSEQALGVKVLNECEILNSFVKDVTLIQKAVEMMLFNRRARICNMKLLHAACVTSMNPPADLMSTVLIRCLCTAENEEQMAVFASFLETVLPFNAEGLRKAIVTKGSKRERKAICEGLDDFKRRNELWIRNMKTLMEWERKATASQIMSHMGLLMLDNWGEVMNDALAWALDTLSDLYESKDERNVTEKIVSTTNLIISFVVTSNHATYLRNEDSYQITAQVAGMLILLLRFIGIDEALNAVIDAYESVFVCFIKFFYPLPVRMAQRSQLIIHLLDEVFEISAELFGSRKNMPTWDEENFFAAGCDEFMLGLDTESDIMEQLESLSTEHDRASQVAHSGRLVKRGPSMKHGQLVPQSDEIQRRLIFLKTLRTIVGKDKRTDDRTIVQHLAVDLTQRFCGDSMLGYYGWDDWEVERDLLSKHVMTAKAFTDSGIGNDILTLVAREGAVWYAYPLIKIILAGVLIGIESKSYRQRHDRLSEETILQLNSAFSYFVRSLIIPARLMCCTIEVAKRSTVHEAGVLFTTLWKYLSAVAPSHQQLFVDRNGVAISEYGKFGPKTTHLAVAWRQSMSYLIQKYQKDLDEKDDDEWTIEYQPPSLFLPDMKR
ncbi:hypothetical protein L596_011818 [Steinernema carpocapsae]|uniref:Uncharacterized protein n=1 Tax=Steinernema carpocapsae TaxID=34508 RepID=A0A4U5NV87_STECR|nr:hypothetical protein L596_011818 [Steinernema carpocapsae]